MFASGKRIDTFFFRPIDSTLERDLLGISHCRSFLRSRLLRRRSWCIGVWRTIPLYPQDGSFLSLLFITGASAAAAEEAAQGVGNKNDERRYH